jgi:hypothetical protein
VFGRCPARAQSTFKEDFLRYRDGLAGWSQRNQIGSALSRVRLFTRSWQSSLHPQQCRNLDISCQSDEASTGSLVTADKATGGIAFGPENLKQNGILLQQDRRRPDTMTSAGVGADCTPRFYSTGWKNLGTKFTS